MSFYSLIFYFLSFFLLASALMAVVSRYHVHSVLWLILAIVNTAGLFLLIQAEFIAMVLIILYVGAVAVLFLFVVMMNDFSQDASAKLYVKSWFVSLGVVLGFVLGFLFLLFFMNDFRFDKSVFSEVNSVGLEEISEVVYSKYFFSFIGVGLVLFVAMIGAIILTLQKNNNVKKQDISEQVKVRPKEILTLVKDI